MGIMDEEMRRADRKRKNRESAERNRQEKNESIENLQTEITNLSKDIHRISVDNWYLQQSAPGNCDQTPFPTFTAPILEPAVF